MKRLLILFMGIMIVLSLRDPAYAETPMDSSDFESMFDDHGAVMDQTGSQACASICFNDGKRNEFGFFSDAGGNCIKCECVFQTKEKEIKRNTSCMNARSL